MTVSATEFGLFEDFEAVLKRRHRAIMGGGATRARLFTDRLDFGELEPLQAVLRACNAFDDSGRRVMRLPPADGA